VSLLPFLVISFAAASACLVARGRPTLEIPIGLGGLLLATIAALAIVPGDQLKLGQGDVLLGTAYGRLFLALGSAMGLVLCLVGLATTWQANLPAAILVGLGGTGIALVVSDPLIAIIILLASSIAASLVTLNASLSAADVRVVVGHVRVIALAGALAIVAMAWAAPSVGNVPGDAEALGLADFAIVLAVAIRFGAIPFHRPVARLTDSAPGSAIPVLLVWGPAAAAVVVLAATDGSTVPLLVPFGIGRVLIIAIAAASLLLGAIGAWLQDDLEHVVGYSVVQDAGFVLLGLSIAGPAAHEPARAWLLILIAAKTAFAAWATVIRARFRTARLPELSGWGRRSPLLAIALVGIVVGTIGVPGLLAWSVRASLVQGAAGGPLGVVLLIGGLASLAYYGRILIVGFGRPSPLVRAAPADRLVATAHSRTTVEGLRNGWLANRAPIAAGLVLVLVLISVVLAGGGFGGPDAARAAGPPANPAGLLP
jgi:NADH:ubiquinone oxidoreductase subunit 2 (subunit N)